MSQAMRTMMRALLFLALTLLSTVGPAHAVPVTEWSTEYVFLGQVQVENQTHLFNLYQIIRSELVYDITDGIATLLSSRVIRPEEYLQSQFYSQIFGTPLLPSDSPIFGTPQGQSSPAATPEPATLLLFGTTMAGLGLARWRTRRRGAAVLRG